VLVVDDDPALAALVAAHLHEWGLRSREALDEQELWKAVEEAPDLVLLDVFLGPTDGSRLVPELSRRCPRTPVLMVTRSSDIEVAVRSLRNGARDYILKPIDFVKLERAVRDALEWRALQTQLEPSPSPPAGQGERRVDDLAADGREVHGAPSPSPATRAAEMIGASPAIARVREIIQRAGPTNVPVLILGETGTGKELAARALHAASSRRAGPFVAVNASAVPHELIESELFGHEKGAFTGAAERKIGFCERAHQGTLFLDEIGEMAPAVQSKLLRFLQDHEVQRVGSAKPRAVDVRVIAATNVDPSRHIRTGRLREDLFYRLRGVQLVLPPLRQRKGDVDLLAEHFLNQAKMRLGRPELEITTQALQKLREATWPGNVRQLENTLHEAAILCSDDRIDAGDLHLDQHDAGRVEADDLAGASASPVPWSATERAERDAISTALASGTPPEEIAEQLGMSRATLYRRIKAFGLSRPRRRP
jgi:two-component system response regulator HydG